MTGRLSKYKYDSFRNLNIDKNYMLRDRKRLLLSPVLYISLFYFASLYFIAVWGNRRMAYKNRFLINWVMII